MPTKSALVLYAIIALHLSAGIACTTAATNTALLRRIAHLLRALDGDTGIAVKLARQVRMAACHAHIAANHGVADVATVISSAALSIPIMKSGVNFIDQFVGEFPGCKV